MDVRRLQDLLLDPACTGAGELNLVARKPFWDEANLPFEVAGGGAVVRVIPAPGFPKSSLAGSDDELRTIIDCHDAPGWLAASGIIAGWMARHVTNAALDDLLLAHPLYEHLTRPDARGHSRGGRGRLVHWTPGAPTLASIAAPEFLPHDRSAPAVNRNRQAYADAVADLVGRLEAGIDLVELECAARWGLPPARGRRRAPA